MIKRYNDFLNEKLSDKLSGFDEKSLEQQYLDGKIDFFKYIKICFENNIKIPEDYISNEINKNLYNINRYLKLCDEYDYNLPSINLLNKAYDKYQIDLFEYIEISTRYYDIIPDIEFVKNEMNKITWSSIKNYKIDKYILLNKSYGYNFNLSDILKNRLLSNDMTLCEYIKYCYINKIKMLNDNELNIFMKKISIDDLNQSLKIAIEYNNESLLKLLINNGAEIDYMDYYLYPIKNDNLELLKYLNSKVSNVDYNNILLNAIHYNKINIVSYALDNGADISYLKNELKNMILMDQYEMIKYALDNGAEINKYMLNISRSENVKNLLKKYYDKQND